ncbi:winged helix-turn-helix transcriptional regulator [Paracraurococcus ruber]|uniref:Transcriptional regulator n=1 Tax=Paracraurococcus ruber TaxID=77675 RepID=A0ABS1CXS9_9PROT|nr:helix-turn-helix domain-containing protein [Paracraurococcus ruber]MBK1659116.1 transcriptional regulator [Paracraurococcus ruber]TDG30271.1 transcriptional regulator [Paracraurococcus ruber]
MKSGKRSHAPATRPRRYQDACAAAHALDLVGDRWALLVMRELLFGPRRFGDLRAGLPGISANILAQRLAELEAAGVVRRLRLPPPASVAAYALTDWGRESEPIFMALGRWAARSPAHDPTLPIGAASVLMSLRTMFDPARAAGLRARLGLVLDGVEYLARLEDGRLAVAAAPAAGAEAVLAGSPAALAAAIYGGVPLAALEAEGALRLEGDRDLAKRFLGLFPLPPKAGG